MDKIKKLFSDMTDDELILALEQMKEYDSLGIIRSGGILRKKINEIVEVTGNSSSEHIFTGIMGILKESAYRFAPKQKTKREIAMYWWNNLASLQKTQICDTNLELIGSIRRWETLTGSEIEKLYDKTINNETSI